MNGTCTTPGKDEICTKTFVWKLERKYKPTWHILRRWEDNMKLDLKTLGSENVEWIQLGHYRSRFRLLWKY